MDFVQVDNKIFFNKIMVANFSIKKIKDGIFELNNGKSIRRCLLEKYDLDYFRKKYLSKGITSFWGPKNNLTLLQ